MDFSIDDFFRDIEKPELRTPEQTFLEYKRIHQSFSQACSRWLKDNNHNLSRMNQAGARQVFDLIRQTYCTSKNRQYNRSTVGHYYLSEITEISDEICHSQQNNNLVELCVPGKQAKPKQYKIQLIKKGNCWLIDVIASSAGPNVWNQIQI